jgi:RimJ/RimL family protein N-acetyltransferase
MIATSRVAVRHLNEADHAAFCELEGNGDVKKFTGGPSAVSRAAFQRLISARSESCMAICTKNDGRFIGRCGFRQAEGHVELEIFLLPEMQGHGLGAELLDAMISHCAIAFPTSKIGASVSQANSRAVKLLVSRAFRDTGDTVIMKSGLEHSVYVKFG